MRKSIALLVLVALILLVVMAAPAFAKTGTKSGGYWNYTANLNGTDGGAFYTSIHGSNHVFASAADSPHSGYSTTTGKCKVCHAVHAAGIATSVNSSGELITEKLLRGKAADACTYCHLGAGAFATDPYASRPGFAVQWSSMTNYYSNDSSPPTGTPVWTSDGNLPDANNQGAWNPRSGHSATHGHDNPQGSPPAVVKSYKGCVSCHSVHGADTLTDGALKPNILKNDPAKGVTSAVGSGWGYQKAGYGAYYAPVTTQAQFCEDCHDGTKVTGPLVAADSATKVTAIISQASFNTYFPNCGVRNDTQALCHNSIQQDITESVAQFGAFNNKGHNGRSHIMTTTLDGGIAASVTNVDVETVYASGNGCATCHNVPKYNPAGPQQQGAVFPHFWPSDELIQNYSILEPDSKCLGCHAGVGTDY